MSAETLREAAALMRERAEAATQAPRWEVEDGGRIVASDAGPMLLKPEKRESLGIVRSTADAEHIAGMHPGVALAFADLLDHAAARAESKIEHGGKPEPVWSHEADALAVARAYLTTASTKENP